MGMRSVRNRVRNWVRNRFRPVIQCFSPRFPNFSVDMRDIFTFMRGKPHLSVLLRVWWAHSYAHAGTSCSN
jgi:hypothetical protein